MMIAAKTQAGVLFLLTLAFAPWGVASSLSGTQLQSQETPRGTAPAAARDRSMVLILDASGSMWGQIDGKAKIAIAKAVMAELLDELPADLNAGLTVYGHRREGDCDDIEMVTPVRRLDAAAIKSEIQAINPRGKTPIAASLLRSAGAPVLPGPTPRSSCRIPD